MDSSNLSVLFTTDPVVYNACLMYSQSRNDPDQGPTSLLSCDHVTYVAITTDKGVLCLL